MKTMWKIKKKNYFFGAPMRNENETDGVSLSFVDSGRIIYGNSKGEDDQPINLMVVILGIWTYKIIQP